MCRINDFSRRLVKSQAAIVFLISFALIFNLLRGVVSVLFGLEPHLSIPDLPRLIIFMMVVIPTNLTGVVFLVWSIYILRGKIKSRMSHYSLVWFVVVLILQGIIYLQTQLDGWVGWFKYIFPQNSYLP